MTETRSPTRARATIPNHILIRLSAAAGCNPNTIRRYLDGLLRQQNTIDRITVALRGADLGHLVREQSAAPPAVVTAAPRGARG
jgi:hypothetical protein